eukprot:gene10713-14385_t
MIVLLYLFLYTSKVSNGFLSSNRQNFFHHIIYSPFEKQTNINLYDTKNEGSTHTDNSVISQQTLLNHLSDATDGICVHNNATMTLINLIKIGDEYNKEFSDANHYYVNQYKYEEKNGFEKVSGCMATVLIKTKLKGNSVVFVEGFADSRVASGMLAVLVKGLNGFQSKEILEIRPEIVLKYLKLDSLLPPGRLNGLQNMVILIQDQIHKLLNENMNNSSYVKPTFDDDNNYDPRKDEVAVLLSGGVDSSVALKLLLLQGYKVRAYYIKIWLEDEVAFLNECPWEEDLNYAQRVCDQLKVPLETLSLQKEYWEEVVQYTFREARNGRTPNPDVMCNSRIKFGMFYDYIGRFHSKVATGHYAQVRKQLKSLNNKNDNNNNDNEEIYQLLCAPDVIKDQSYFLSNLNQQQISRCLFPIGHLVKTQVRELAEKYDLPTKDRKDSQGICFLGKLKFDDFIYHYLGQNPGMIKCFMTGKIIGEHNGLWFHTIGQRKGLGPLLHPGNIHLGPWYVITKNQKENILYVTNQLDLIDKPRKTFYVNQMNWIGGMVPKELINNHNVTLDYDSIYRVDLLEKDKGIAPGQFSAFYINKECIGAGIVMDQIDFDL